MKCYEIRIWSLKIDMVHWWFATAVVSDAVWCILTWWGESWHGMDMSWHVEEIYDETGGGSGKEVMSTWRWVILDMYIWDWGSIVWRLPATGSRCVKVRYCWVWRILFWTVTWGDADLKKKRRPEASSRRILKYEYTMNIRVYMFLCVLRSINQWVSKSNIMVIAFDKVPKYYFLFTFIVRAFVRTVFATHHVSSIF